MVLLASAVCNKSGKAVVSRQFVEMTRSRIEGLLAAFPKLMNTGSQHTFVETESVRYVYQPLEKLYVLLITTKASNILEDLETLRLFARVVPEYCRALDEKEVIRQAFQLIFAFDEIVALGYRESVNLAQIRTYTEMDSHEERVFKAVRETQEKEAKENMKRKAKELQQLRKDQSNRSRQTGSYARFSPHSSDSAVIEPEPIKPSYNKPTPSSESSSKGMVIRKPKNDDIFVNKIKSEGQEVVAPASKSAHKAPVSSINEEGIHLRSEEKMNVTINRHGGIQNLEIQGLLQLKVNDEKSAKCKIRMSTKRSTDVQLQTHPNVDKKLFQNESLIALKNPDKPFPLQQDIGVLKWRLPSSDKSYLPLSIVVWPEDNGNGGCDVSVQYELERTDLELREITISLPCPSNPTVEECGEGLATYNRSGRLEWNIPVINRSNPNADLQYTLPSSASPDSMFPVDVSFSSEQNFCQITVEEVESVENREKLQFSTQTIFFTESYKII